MADTTLEVIGLGRAFGNADVSGDAWAHLIHPWGERVVLVDGAGHGPLAADAARIAIETLQRSGGVSVDEAFSRCHTALHGTRGAVLTVVDIKDRSATFAGAGNVDGHIVQTESSFRFTADRGLLGSTLPRVHPVTFELTGDDWFIVLHSDGISSRMKPQWAPLAALKAREAYLEEAMATWARPTDDATLVLITPGRGTTSAK